MNARQVKDSLVYAKLVELNLEWRQAIMDYEVFYSNEDYFKANKISLDFVKQALRRLAHRNLVKLSPHGFSEGYKFMTLMK